jgi:lipoprotein-anchoring transpeptidase ErfK/SrfK
MPATSSLGPGMWVEVSVPYVDVILENKPTANSWVRAKVEEGAPVRFYYSQIFWVDRVKTGDQGQVLYRVNPNYYGGVDMLWAAAEAFRPISQDELTPINAEAEDKHIEVDVTYQTLSCYEGDKEVYFCRVSTGAKYDMYGNVVDNWSTPVGQHRVSRKYISLQMSGGTTGAGYDLPGIGWTSIFANGGVAIHSTFWHNNYGDPMSHGCVNVSPDDAKWIFRWTTPTVPFDPGMVDISLTGAASTPVKVVER